MNTPGSKMKLARSTLFSRSFLKTLHLYVYMIHEYTVCTVHTVSTQGDLHWPLLLGLLEAGEVYVPIHLLQLGVDGLSINHFTVMYVCKMTVAVNARSFPIVNNY
jgi:hypothetical protein